MLDEILPEDFGGVGASGEYAADRNRFGRGQECWAHLLRKAIALMLAHPEKGAYLGLKLPSSDLWDLLQQSPEDLKLPEEVSTSELAA